MERNRMKIAPGLLLAIALLVLLAAILVGGQVWVLTGSTPLGIGAIVFVGGFLAIGALPLARRLTPTGNQFLGEYHGPLKEGDFADVAQVVSEAGAKGKIRQGVDERPERVAESVRSLLAGRGKGKNRTK
jgi:hypothetical protein